MRTSVLILGALGGATVVVGATVAGAALLRGDGADASNDALAGAEAGVRLVLEAEPPAGAELDESGMDLSAAVMQARADRLDSVLGASVERESDDLLVLELALADPAEADRVVDVLTAPARLEFYRLQEDVAGPSSGTVAQPVVPRTVRELRSLLERAPAPNEAPPADPPTAWYLLEGDELVAGPAPTRDALLAQAGDRASSGDAYVVPPERIVLTCSEDVRSCPGVGTPQEDYYYLFEYRPDDAGDPVPQITGDDLILRGTTADFDRGQPIVTLEFDDEGGRKFHQVTRELAQRGRQVCALTECDDGLEDTRAIAFQSFAIVLDGEIRSFPTIDFVELPDGIAGDRAQISGLGSEDEAYDLALALRTGALPYDFRVAERADLRFGGEGAERDAQRARSMRAIMNVLPRHAPGPTDGGRVAREEPAGR